MVVFDPTSVPSSVQLDIIPFVPTRFTALDSSGGNLFTNLDGWSFWRPPLGENGKPLFMPGQQENFKFVGRE
jgi:hypothetical protein